MAPSPYAYKITCPFCGKNSVTRLKRYAWGIHGFLTLVTAGLYAVVWSLALTIGKPRWEGIICGNCEQRVGSILASGFERIPEGPPQWVRGVQVNKNPPSEAFAAEESPWSPAFTAIFLGIVALAGIVYLIARA